MVEDANPLKVSESHFQTSSFFYSMYSKQSLATFFVFIVAAINKQYLCQRNVRMPGTVNQNMFDFPMSSIFIQVQFHSHKSTDLPFDSCRATL